MEDEASSPTSEGYEPLELIEILTRQVRAGEAVGLASQISQADFDRWKLVTKEVLRRIYSDDSVKANYFIRAGNDSSIQLGGYSISLEEANRKSLAGKIDALNHFINKLKAEVEVASLDLGPPSMPKSAKTSNRVFLVHGRNDGVRESVARFLEKLSLPVTILHEQSNRGRTVIEKFEDHAAEVGFAVVLLTGDDMGGLSTDPADTYRLRARQNVILELGYFLAKLGRGRVCALYEPGVEIPSDYSGVLFIELDPNRRWHVELARELKAAGFTVDMNKAFD